MKRRREQQHGGIDSTRNRVYSSNNRGFVNASNIHVRDSVLSQREPRRYTVSIAVPGSIVANAQSAELRTYLVGQVARAATVYNVDEIVVFSEDATHTKLEGEFKGARRRDADMNAFFARVLQYLETPQYLRRMLYPVHPDLKYAGLLNPLDAPHHVRAATPAQYREGVVTRAPASLASLHPSTESSRSLSSITHKSKVGSMVNVGLRKDVRVDRSLPVGVRVTVKMNHPKDAIMGKGMLGKVVSPSAPREELGMYWGYNVRIACGISKVFTECPYKGGYDLTIGTSERGKEAQHPDFKVRPFQHLMILFGGVGGLEDCVLGDHEVNVSDPRDLCDTYINTCTHQGSGTIRTEEAILITMSVLHPHILSNRTTDA